jgi:hypothetical protein
MPGDCALPDLSRGPLPDSPPTVGVGESHRGKVDLWRSGWRLVPPEEHPRETQQTGGGKVFLQPDSWIT